MESIKYENEEHTYVAVYLDERTIDLPNGDEKTFSEHHSGVYEGTRAWRKYVQPYLDRGGIITSYEDSISLADYKRNAIEVNRTEAGRKIALLFGTVEDGYIHGSDKLNYKIANNQAEAIALTLKVAKTTNDASDDARLVVLGDLRDDVIAIRDEENLAARAIDLAEDKLGVDVIMAFTESVSLP